MKHAETGGRRTGLRTARTIAVTFAGAAAIAGLAVGLASCTAFAPGPTADQTGDEPPIRVKSGSIDLDLLSTVMTWEPDGSSGNWKLSGGERKKDDLDLVLVVAQGATCNGLLDPSGKTLELHYTGASHNDDAEIDIKSQGRHTHVLPKGKAMKNTAQSLMYDPPGYISSVVLDGATICTFASPDQLRKLIILDY